MHTFCASVSPPRRIKASPTEDAQTPAGPRRLLALHPRVARSGAQWGGCSTRAPQILRKENRSRVLHAQTRDAFVKHPCWSSRGQETFQKVLKIEEKKRKKKKSICFSSPAHPLCAITGCSAGDGEGRKLPQPRRWAEHPKTFCCVPGEMKLSRDGDGEGWQRGAGSALGSLCPAFPPWFSFPRCSWLRGTPGAHEAQISERGGGPERDQLPAGRGWGPAARPKGPP